MRYQPGDWVTVIEDTTVEVGDRTVSVPAGMRLTVLDVRDGAVKVLDVSSRAAVWIPDSLVRRA